MAIQAAKSASEKVSGPAPWAHAIRRRLGLRPPQRLNWLLERVLYGHPARHLEDQEVEALWKDILVLVIDTTAEEWRPLGPEKTDVEVYTSDDADMARWQELEKESQDLVKRSRRRSTREVDPLDLVELVDGGLPPRSVRSGPAETLR